MATPTLNSNKEFYLNYFSILMKLHERIIYASQIACTLVYVHVGSFSPTQFLTPDTDLWWQIRSPQSIYCNSQNCKTISIKLKVLCSVVFTCWKLGPWWVNIFLSHFYILVFPPKSLFSLTLILICIPLSLVTLLGNDFSFHFITLRYKRNVISYMHWDS